jgi:hypothetical protein
MKKETGEFETHYIVNDEGVPYVRWFISPEKSGWKCELFGSTNCNFAWYPDKGCVPNWFVRFFMRICFDCKWTKES